MSFKLRNSFFFSAVYSITLLFGFAITNVAIAVEEDRKLQIHGFIAQGIIDASGSDFVNDDQDLSFELTEVGINSSYQISDNLRLAGQAVYLNGGNRYAEGARVDYALIDWSAYQSLSSQLNIYIGRYKNYHWLYSTTRDVPFARPSIVLPQSIYFDGFRDIAVGGDGIALSFKHNKEGWGDFDFNLSYGTSIISDKQRKIILSKLSTGDMEHDLDYQASIYWQPQDSQWRFGWAGLDSDFTYDMGKNDSFLDADITLQRFILNALYEGENWEFSGEAFQERFVFTGFYSPYFKQDNLGQGFFVQSRYQWKEKIRVLARYEKFFANKDDKNGSGLEESSFGTIPSYFGYQHDAVLGVSIDFTSNLRLQLEHHWVEGTARLTPVVLPNAAINDEEHWQMWAAQLMYWF
ncbi:hypothetical protein HII17_09330 [Thalassotalea sp. M1531]|uniref:Porin n=1 Tax=Thalassotalea algicola TaxID=2716224 RepID=A0A7Y0LC09_9GAMM|nr:hypothetical protein [Thalassotalea algicola]NMP31764.1 hypothetical protein [Thalassotalea algicola]